MAQEAIDEAGNIWIVDGFDANGNPINPRPKPRAQSKGTIYTPPPQPKAPPAPNLPTGWQLGPDGVARPVQGLPAEIVNPKGAKPADSPPDVTAKIRADALRQFNGARMLNQAQANMVEAYKKGPGKTKGIWGLADYIPGFLSESNQNFNKDAEAGRGMVVQGLGLTGGSLNSMPEAQMWTGPYTPSSSDWDSTTRKNIDRIAPLRETAARDAISILGGVPDLDGKIHPLGSPRANEILASAGLSPDLKASPNVWDQDSNTTQIRAAQGSLGNAVSGNTRTRYERNPEIEAQVRAAFLRGASLEELNAITIPAGYGPISPQDYAAGVKERQRGRGDAVTFTIGKDVPLTRAEEFIGSPTGAAIAGLTNAGSFGAVQALAPQYNDLTGLNPNSALLGEVAGTIAGTAGLGRLGTAAVERALPSTLAQRILQGGGRKGAFARNLGADATYGGVYGAMTEGDPLKGAGQAALGSGAGQLVGGTIGRTIGGLRRAPGAQELADRGIPLTVGQNMGGMVKAIEDRATSLPVVGDLIRSRRLEGLQAFNRSAFNEAGAPIGAVVDDTGQPALQRLLGDPDNFADSGLTGQAYRQAIGEARVPVDDVFRQEMADISARQMPDDYARAFDDVGRLRVAPAIQGGELTGEGYQQAMRGIGAAKRKADAVGVSGFEDVYRNNLSDMQGALRGQMLRGGGEGVVEGLGRADQAYRLAKVLENAVGRAKGGTGSGEVDIFTPAQLMGAADANAKKFGGRRPFNALADAGQRVLPSQIPNSGTADRLMQFGLPTAIVGGGAGLGAYGGGMEGAQTGGLLSLGTLAALAAGGTKGGQKALNKVLFDRPAALRSPKAGRAIGKLKGLFGSAAVPLFIE